MNLWAGNETLKPEALETERQEQNCCHLQPKIFMTPSHPEDLQAEHCQSYSPFLGGGEGVTDHSKAICWENVFFFFSYFLIWLRWVLVVACAIYFPSHGSNLGPLHWKHGVSATGPPGKALLKCLNHGKLYVRPAILVNCMSSSS